MDDLSEEDKALLRAIDTTTEEDEFLAAMSVNYTTRSGNMPVSFLAGLILDCLKFHDRVKETPEEQG